MKEIKCIECGKINPTSFCMCQIAGYELEDVQDDIFITPNEKMDKVLYNTEDHFKVKKENIITISFKKIKKLFKKTGG